MPKANKGAQLRAAAASAVHAVVDEGRTLDAALLVVEPGVALQDRALLQLLCYGTLRFHFRIGRTLDGLIERPFKTRDRVVRSLLAVALYQFSETRIPDHAVVSESVEAARALRRPACAGLVNAVLRRYLREHSDSTNAVPLEESDETVRCNHPQWLIDAVRADWPDDWQSILAANDERAPMWLRANAGRVDVAGYLARLQQAGKHGAPLAGFTEAIRLDEPCAVEKLPGFESGDVSVQDAAAQLAAPLILASRPHRVLDACAAPGGKSAHLLELGPPDLSLTCLDIDKQRLSAVGQTLARLGKTARLIAADASVPTEWWDSEPYDAILVDAPCSATGVIRRHPDIKLLRRASDLAALAARQLRLLEGLWPLLRPGGRLLYVTCSVLAMENETLIGHFLDTHRDADELPMLPANNIRAVMRQRPRGAQILPGTAGMDGFYYACLVRMT